MKIFLSLLAVPVCAAAFFSAAGSEPADPFSSPASARVLLFVRTDCPITNRYAPELRRISREFDKRGITFWIVYPDPSETAGTITAHMAKYGFPGKPVRDVGQQLVRRAKVTVAPEAAVFDSSGNLLYHGRIDNRWVDIGMARPTATVHDLEDAIGNVLAKKPVASAETRAVGCALADLQ